MEVIYTPEVFSGQGFGGISRYIVELASGVRAAGEKARIIAGIHVNSYARGRPDVLGAYSSFAAYRSRHVRMAFNRLLCRAALLGSPRALVHQTYFADTAYLGRRRPLVVTVYDMIHELFHERYPELGHDPTTFRFKRSSCERADHIIAISETTRTDLIRLFGIDPTKVTAILLGNSMAAPAEAAGPVGNEDPFCSTSARGPTTRISTPSWKPMRARRRCGSVTGWCVTVASRSRRRSRRGSPRSG